VNDTIAVLQAPKVELVRPVRPSTRHAVRAVGAAALAAAVLGFVFPRVVGTTAADVRAAFGAVSGREACVLVLLWAAGLLTHSFVLTGALPGLSRRRALTLNLTGSAVANTLPFGGAAGMSMNYVMIRSWGVDAARFASFTLVTNLWGILLKLLMPALALAVLWLTGRPVSPTTRWTAVSSIVVFFVLVAAGVAALASRRTAERAIGVAAPAIARIGRVLRRRTDRVCVSAAFLDCRDTVRSVLVERWGQLSLGTAGYAALQALLLWACLHAVGGHVVPADVLAGYAVDRVLTLAVITPGATGFAEAGIAAALVALGGAPAAMAAGVLLYRGFTFALEIPVGGAWLAGWLLRRRGRASASPGGAY
jgi:putative heme transporter